MLFNVKKKFMTAVLDKKKKNQPFDFEKAESFALSSKDGRDINNSYYFSAHSADKNESVYLRLGLRGEDTAEVWACCDFDGAHYVLKKNDHRHNNSPLSVSREGVNWRVRFEGVLDCEKESVPCAVDCVFSPTAKAVDFFSDMPSLRTATAMAQEKWTKEFFAEVQKNNQVHYEQEGLFAGTVKIGDEIREISLPCVRDHSFGKRDWNYMNNHLWLMGVSSKCQFNFSVVSYPSISLLEVGNIRFGSTMRFMTRAEYDRSAIVTGEIPSELSVKMTLKGEKQPVPVNVKLINCDEYFFDGGKYRLIEGLATFTVGREICRGILEIGFNADSRRFMNGKKTGDLKA